MIRSTITTTVLMALSAIPTAFAYSGMQNLDSKDAAQLKEEGITISSWKHDVVGELPPVSWVEVSYDWKRGADLDVLMTLHLTGSDGKPLAASRAEHKKGDAGPLKLLFAVRKECVENSYLQIVFPASPDAAPAQRIGLGDGPHGYYLQVGRILELTGQDPGKEAVIGLGIALPSGEAKTDSSEATPPATGNAKDGAKGSAKEPESNKEKEESKPTTKSSVFKCGGCGLIYERCSSSNCGLGPDEHREVNHVPKHEGDCAGLGEVIPAGK